MENNAFINIENLNFGYGSKEVLKDFSAKLGTEVIVQGPSGRGKSTLLKTIAGLLKPENGKVQCGAKKPAFLFQENRLFPGFTVLENVMSVEGDREKALAWLEFAELGDKANAPWEELSGGEQRRAALARTLAYGGDLLLLDEPFNGLDKDLAQRIAGRIKNLGIPYIIITHSEVEKSFFPSAQILKL